MLIFKENKKILTLGVEMEFQVLEADTLRLTPRAAEFLEELPKENLSKEMFRSTLEIITGVCDNVHEASKELSGMMDKVEVVAKEKDIRFAGTGTNPVADYMERLLSDSPRYHHLIDRNQWLIRRMAVYGLHIHIGLSNGDQCIRYNNFFLHFLPHLLALSASSPFWRSLDTGLSLSRPTIYESHPTSGMPYLVKDWVGFNEIYNALLKTGSIESTKDIWWDIRPSPYFGTLELRMCDGPATLLELESITAFVHALSHWFEDNQEQFFTTHSFIPEQWILRENKWRAIRHGLNAEIVEHNTLSTISLRENIRDWLTILTPYFNKLNYSTYKKCLLDICEKGNSSDRQKAVMAKHNDLEKVLEHNVREFESRVPEWEV